MNILKNYLRTLISFFTRKEFKFLFRFMLAAGLMILWRHAFADEDPLAGTEKSLVATLGSGGTGRKYLYITEGILAIAAYIKTKNLLVLPGVVVIAIFMNILFKMAGLMG